MILTHLVGCSARLPRRKKRQSGSTETHSLLALGSSEDLITLANTAVKKTKTQLATDMTRHLVIADPRNGVEFIHEVGISSALPIFAIFDDVVEESFGSEGLLFAVLFFNIFTD